MKQPDEIVMRESVLLIDFLDQIADVLLAVRNLRDKAIFATFDARETFFGKLIQSVFAYYVSHVLMLVNPASIDLSQLSDRAKKHLPAVDWMYDDDFKGIVKNDLLQHSWLSFESSLDAIFNSIATSSEIEDIQYKNFNKTVSLLEKMTHFAEDEIDLSKLRKILFVKHISVTEKWSKTFAICKSNYPSDRTLKQDIRFLEFFSSCRNTVHNNSVSFKDEVYDTKLGIFSFRKNDLLDFLSQPIVLKMVEELANIFHAIRISLNYPELIEDISVKF